MVSVSLKPLDTWLSFLSVIHSLATISYFLPPNKNIFFFSRAHGVIIRFLLISVDRTGQSYIASHCIPSHKLSGSQMWMCGEKRMHFHYCFLCCYFLHTLLLLLLFCFCFFYFFFFLLNSNALTVVIHFSSLVVARPTNNEIPSKMYNNAEAMVMHRFFSPAATSSSSSSTSSFFFLFNSLYFEIYFPCV